MVQLMRYLVKTEHSALQSQSFAARTGWIGIPIRPSGDVQSNLWP